MEQIILANKLKVNGKFVNYYWTFDPTNSLVLKDFLGQYIKDGDSVLFLANASANGYLRTAVIRQESTDCGMPVLCIKQGNGSYIIPCSKHILKLNPQQVALI